MWKWSINSSINSNWKILLIKYKYIWDHMNCTFSIKFPWCDGLQIRSVKINLSSKWVLLRLSLESKKCGTSMENTMWLHRKLFSPFHLISILLGDVREHIFTILTVRTKFWSVKSKREESRKQSLGVLLYVGLRFGEHSCVLSVPSKPKKYWK